MSLFDHTESQDAGHGPASAFQPGDRVAHQDMPSVRGRVLNIADQDGRVVRVRWDGYTVSTLEPTSTLIGIPTTTLVNRRTK